MIGANAIILDVVKNGEECVIEVGAVITIDCEPFGIYGGITAKLMKKREMVK